MIPEVGKAYYFMSHAYHHYIGVVMEVSPKKVMIKNAIKVHGCARNWQQFFQEGLGNDTNYHRIPDGSVVPWELGFFPWKHPTLP